MKKKIENTYPRFIFYKLNASIQRKFLLQSFAAVCQFSIDMHESFLRGYFGVGRSCSHAHRQSPRVTGAG